MTDRADQTEEPAITDPGVTQDTGEEPPEAAPKPSRGRVAEDGSLTVYSKRSERQRKRQLRRSDKNKSRSGHRTTFLDLPFDILIEVLALCRPSDIFRLSRTCRSLHTFLLQEHPALIARSIIRWRYPCLAECMRLPVLVSDIHDTSLRELVQDEGRQRELDMSRRPYYQHVTSPDPSRVCTCTTCFLRWHILSIAVDFAHWQGCLDAGNPLPIVPRGRRPEWNSKLLDSHAAILQKALNLNLNNNNNNNNNNSPDPHHSGGDTPSPSPLWHAAILEAHLDSAVRSIRRHSANKGNKRPRFRMTDSDAASGTDAFLQRSGPPCVDFPFNRDNYYILEAYLPNRSWIKEEARWVYMPAEQHERDLAQMKKWASTRPRPVLEGIR